MIKQALDIGHHDRFLVPMVNSAAEAGKKSAAACKIPSRGHTRSGHPRARQWLRAEADYTAKANARRFA